MSIHPLQPCKRMVYRHMGPTQPPTSIRLLQRTSCRPGADICLTLRLLSSRCSPATLQPVRFLHPQHRRLWATTRAPPVRASHPPRKAQLRPLPRMGPLLDLRTPTTLQLPTRSSRIASPSAVLDHQSTPSTLGSSHRLRSATAMAHTAAAYLLLTVPAHTVRQEGRLSTARARAL